MARCRRPPTLCPAQDKAEPGCCWCCGRSLWQRLKVPVHQARHSPVCHVQPLAPWPTLATVSGQVVLSLTATHLVKLTGGVEGVHLHTLVTAPGGLALVGLGPAREGERQEAADWPPPLHRSYWHPTFTSHHSQAAVPVPVHCAVLHCTVLQDPHITTQTWIMTVYHHDNRYIMLCWGEYQH